jgi:hypothetical protein
MVRRLPEALIAALTLIGAALTAQQAHFTFEPAQPDMFAAGTLTNAWADYDGDGDADLFVGFNGAPNRLYRNDAGTLRDIAAEAGIADARATRASAWGDYDGDGDPDLLLGHTPGTDSVLRLYRNTSGRFTDVTAASGLVVDKGAVRQPAWVDIDADGDLDLFVAFRDRPNALFMNTGGRFRDIAGNVGLADPRRSVGAVWFDYDQDGDLDLYVANQDGDANGLFRHDRRDGQMQFTDVAAATATEWAGRAPREATNGTVRPCAFDADGDGWFDLFGANYGPNAVLLLDRSGNARDASRQLGLATDGRFDTCAPADVDNDGRMDLYVNGTITGGVAYRDFLFHRGEQAFSDATPDNVRALPASHGASWADFDADGDLDLALAGTTSEQMPLLLRNQLTADAGRRSLKLRVVDRQGRATKVGAEVRAFRAGTQQRLGAALVDSGSGYNSQSDLPVHLGLRDAAQVDVQVTFPGAGRRSITWLRGIVATRSRTILVRMP